jgi:hypothetical protein
MTGSNPFATRFTRPGAIEFLFPGGQSAESLVERLRAESWWGQIIGPHGSGKSTLLATLAPALEQAGRMVVSLAATAGRPLPQIDLAALTPRVQLVIDGCEQYGWLTRCKIQAVARDRGAGLLVTTHADLGLPTLLETQPSVELAELVVRRLLPPGDATVADDDVRQAFARHKGNLRETLFALFDLYQARTRTRAEGPPCQG